MNLQAPLIIDVAGHKLSDADKLRLSHPLVGGVILFGRNWKDREQLSKLCRKIKKVRPDVVIFVDHEGGRVQRFKTDGFTHLPPMRALGAHWLRHGDAQTLSEGAMQSLQAAQAMGFVIAAELRACGVDVSFAPVLDLDHGPSSVIGDRSLGRAPAMVALLGQALMAGMRRAGMAHCAKHFPGHGYAHADSHVAVPVDERSLDALLADDAWPYAWLRPELSAVMPAHVVYPAVDKQPAGFSHRWLQTVLRGQLGFEGAIITDDLGMAGARRIGQTEISPATAAQLALQAGCDMVMLCNQSVHEDGAALDAWIQTMTEDLLAGEWAINPASEVRRLALLPSTPAPDWTALQARSDYQRAQQDWRKVISPAVAQGADPTEVLQKG